MRGRALCNRCNYEAALHGIALSLHVGYNWRWKRQDDRIGAAAIILSAYLLGQKTWSASAS
jgi:uncharacterized membrane protein